MFFIFMFSLNSKLFCTISPHSNDIWNNFNLNKECCLNRLTATYKKLKSRKNTDFSLSRKRIGRIFACRNTAWKEGWPFAVSPSNNEVLRNMTACRQLIYGWTIDPFRGFWGSRFSCFTRRIGGRIQHILNLASYTFQDGHCLSCVWSFISLTAGLVSWRIDGRGWHQSI